MGFVTLGLFVVGVIAWMFAIVLKPFGLVDVDWHYLLAPIYLAFGIVFLFFAGVFGLWFVFWVAGVL